MSFAALRAREERGKRLGKQVPKPLAYLS